MLPKIKEEFIDKGIVQYGLSDYPLSFHAGAKSVAAAVRCAGEQEKYWQMYADMFEDRGKTRSQGYRPLAEKNGLDINKFQTCLDNPLTVAAVEADVAFGEKLGVDGTPRFLIGVLEDGQLKNMKLIKGARDFDTFAKVINELKGK